MKAKKKYERFSKIGQQIESTFVKFIETQTADLQPQRLQTASARNLFLCKNVNQDQKFHLKTKKAT